MKTKKNKYFLMTLLFLGFSLSLFFNRSASAETAFCNSDSQCASGQKCITIIGTSSKTCRTPLANGELCSPNVENTQCSSGNCVEFSTGIAKCAPTGSQNYSGSANQNTSPTGSANGAGSCVYDTNGECKIDSNGNPVMNTNVGADPYSSSANLGNDTYSTNQYNSGFGDNYGAGAGFGTGTVNCDSGTLVSGVCIPTNTGLPNQSVQTIVVNLMNWLLGIFAVVGVIAFLISGIQYLVASGDSKIMETAKRNMIYSIIGILVGLSGLIIIRAAMSLFSANPLI